MSENIPQFSQPQPIQPVPPTEPYTGYPTAYPVAAVAKSSGLGIAALITSIVVFIGSLIWAADNGVGVVNALGSGTATDFGSGFQEGLEIGSTAAGAAVSFGIIMHVVIGTLVGVTALVLGIIAIVTKRGRPQGIAAVIIAAIAPVLSFFVYTFASAFASM